MNKNSTLTIRFHNKQNLKKFSKKYFTLKAENKDYNYFNYLELIVISCKSHNIPNFTAQRGERMKMPKMCVGMKKDEHQQLKKQLIEFKPSRISDVVNYYLENLK